MDKIQLNGLTLKELKEFIKDLDDDRCFLVENTGYGHLLYNQCTIELIEYADGNKDIQLNIKTY